MTEDEQNALAAAQTTWPDDGLVGAQAVTAKHVVAAFDTDVTVQLWGPDATAFVLRDERGAILLPQDDNEWMIEPGSFPAMRHAHGALLTDPGYVGDDWELHEGSWRRKVVTP
jgi:hypothetical protein